MSYDPNTGEWIEDGVGTAPPTAPDTEALTPPGTSPTQGGPDSAVDVDQVSSGFQALADQAGNAPQGTYSGYENPSDAIEDVEVQQGENYFTPETQVATQLERLLGKDSALSQQSRVEAREVSSALGMMSSTGAIGAQRRADIKALTPVAMQDAETASKFQMQQQQVENEISKIQVEAEVSGSLTQQKAQIQEQATRINQEWDALMQGMNSEAQAMLQDNKGKWQEAMTNLEYDLRRELGQMEIDATAEQSVMNAAHESMNNYQITVQNLLANDAFLDNFAGDQTAMYGFFDDLFVTVSSNIKLAAQTANVYEYTRPDGSTGGMKNYIDDLIAANAW